MRHEPQVTYAFLCSQVKALVEYIEASKTLRNADEIADVVDAILEGNPTLKLEEVKHAFDLIKRGKLLPKMYERLKGPEILNALCEYEGTLRADAMERAYEESKPKAAPRKAAQSKRDFLHLTEADLKALGKV